MGNQPDRWSCQMEAAAWEQRRAAKTSHLLRRATMGLLRVHGDRILNVQIDPTTEVPVYQQVYLGVRRAITDGIVEPGSRLPSTRSLAGDLGVSRNTVVMAYEKLRGEGYTVGRGGADTRVAPNIPDRVMRAPRIVQPGTAARRAVPRVSALAKDLTEQWRAAAPPLESPPGAFRAGVPATDLFPYALWGRLLSRRWSRVTARDLGYSSLQGYLPLRAAIASYVGAARGVLCSPDQVFLVGGAQGAISLAAKLVVDRGDKAWIEDPGYIGARNAFAAAGAEIVHVPVDAEGLRVDEGIRLAKDARAVFVTPSRQMPMGMALSRARRAALLAWATKQRSWIVEDDYDSELRFAARPLPALQSEDSSGCVLYVGSFSKVLFPALRLGYLIVPPELVDVAMGVRYGHDIHPPMLEQRVLTDFLEGGHFERHVRRLRQVYFERQDALRDAVRRQLRGILEIPPTEAGLFVTSWLNGINDADAARAAARHNVDVLPVSRLAVGPAPSGLVLGYAGLNVTDILEGVRGLAAALTPLARRVG